jgi:hypothetical protein
MPESVRTGMLPSPPHMCTKALYIWAPRVEASVGLVSVLVTGDDDAVAYDVGVLV